MDDCCVYCVEATDDTDAIFIQTGPLQRGEGGSMRYQLEGIGQIQPGSSALSPRTSSISYGKIGYLFFQSSAVCYAVAAVGPIFLQVVWCM
jgi:hypothetical protein